MNIQQIILCLALSVVMPAAVTPLFGQISLAPVALVVHDDTNVGSLYITNRSNTAKEVFLTMEFGYPDSDSLGHLVMNYDDAEKAEQYGLDDKSRIFPGRFVLEADDRQTVRMQVLPDGDMPDGTYWSRIRVISNPVANEPEQQEEEGISTNINYRFEQNIGAFYQRGNTTTGVKIEDIRVENRKEENTLVVIPALSRTGNSPFLGSLRAELYSPGGERVAETETTTTVYFQEKRRFELDTNGLSPGDYRLELTFETKRRDISAGNLVQAPAVTETIPVNL